MLGHDDDRAAARSLNACDRIVAPADTINLQRRIVLESGDE
jgi:hypothetical protein